MFHVKHFVKHRKGHIMHKLREMLMEELRNFETEAKKKGELPAGTLEVIHKLTDTIKNLDKIEMYEEFSGESYEGESYAQGGRGGNRGGGRGGNRGGYSRADDMEMESFARRRRGGRRSSNGYSYDDGREDMMEQLESLEQMAQSEEERKIIRRAMQQLEKA